jgi:hypothetical protein
MDDELDLIADLNAEDDDGLGWSTIADAPRPERGRPRGSASRRKPLRRRSYGLSALMTTARSTS